MQADLDAFDVLSEDDFEDTYATRCAGEPHLYGIDAEFRVYRGDLSIPGDLDLDAELARTGHFGMVVEGDLTVDGVLFQEETLDNVDVGQLLAAVRDHHPGIAIQSDVATPMLSDAPRLEQLVGQLVRGGLERGGPVAVRAFETDDRRVHIEVRDTGPEISPLALARIEDPFGQADPRRPDGGLSLALAVARALCASLLGAFRVRSDPHGTTVRVSFARVSR